MGIFSSIMDKIFHRKPQAAPAAASHGQPAAATAAQPRPAAAAPVAPAQPVDVEEVLTGLAAQKGGGGNWRTSIVDLLKLLDLDSSLEARKELAAELGVNAGAHGSAEQNIALSKAVWAALAKNGGKVPASLRD
jgi:pyruvate/2-oxoglutarate dehydrogenase complex dihydrolipoamide acyltransferase (E2) component